MDHIKGDSWPENRPLDKVCEPDDKDVHFSPQDSAVFLAPNEHVLGNECFLELLEQHRKDFDIKSQLENQW